MRPQAEAPARGAGTRIGASRLSALAAGCWLLLLTLLLHHSALDGYWRFDDGWLLELGTHADLLAADGLYAHLWRLQASERPIATDERVTVQA